MRPILYIALLSTLTFGSLLDFSYLQDAKDAYSKGEYQKAGELYGKVQSDEATFNRANSLYKQGKYKQALDSYNSITDSKLSLKKFSNIGNTQYKLGNFEKAIESYKKALKIKDDEDIRYNLELSKKKIKKKKEKNRNNKKQNKQYEKDKNGKEKQKKDKNGENKLKDKNGENNSTKNSDQNITKRDKGKNSKPTPTQAPTQTPKPHQNLSAEQNRTQPPISNMEERKWQKMLNNRKVNTLMLPLNRGERNEKNLW